MAIRYPLLLVALAAAAAFLFARPEADDGTIRIPARSPAADAGGEAGWVWPDGTPGWPAGHEIESVNVSGVQPVELEAARLAAARSGLDADGVRVVTSMRGSANGVLAILAAPTQNQTPARTCLAPLLEGTAPVRWQCPGASRLLVAAKRYEWASTPLYLVGVVRGDVHRVVLAASGFQPETLYERGSTWGQFQAAIGLPRGEARLKLYDRKGLVETRTLDVRPGQQRVVR
jgi:hypothetical protein